MLYEAKEKIKIQKGTGIDKNTGENTNTNSNRAWNCAYCFIYIREELELRVIMISAFFSHICLVILHIKGIIQLVFARISFRAGPKFSQA